MPSTDAAGMSLAALMDGRTFSPEEAFAILRQIATAVDDLHANGAAHAPLRPSTVIVDDEQTVRLAECTLDEAQLETEDYAEAAVYLAPEQLAGAEMGAKADQFVLGEIAYRMLLGRAPFAANGLAERLFLVRFGIVDRSAHASVGLAAQGVFDRAFSVAPEHRFDSCAAFVEALERVPRRSYSETRLLDSEESPAADVEVAPPEPAAKKRSSAVLWAAAAAISLVAFLLGLANWRAQTELYGIAAKKTQLANQAEIDGLHNGKLEVCNSSTGPLRIRQVAAAYMDAESHLKVFNSAEHMHEDWSIAPAQSESLSWRVGSTADWDGSVLFYFLKIERDQREYVVAGRWDGAVQGCLHIGR